MSLPILGRPTGDVVALTLDHAGMSVADLDRSTSFYIDVFGFAVEERFAIPNSDVRGAVLIHPHGARIELFHRPGSSPRPTGHPTESTREQGWFQTAFRVANVPDVFMRVVAAGATAVKEPFVAPDGRSTVAFIGDPDGNLIELIQRDAVN
jgi:lactoylglutathione lyase